MILLYILFFVCGVIAFFVMSRLGIYMRVSIALAIFVIPSLVATLWIIKIGDKAPPDAITIYPDAKEHNVQDINDTQNKAN